MFIARMLFFRLHESPRFLVHAGRPQDALKSLQMISRFNGSDISIELADVRDHHHPHTETNYDKIIIGTDTPGSETRTRANSRTVFAASVIEDRASSSLDSPSRNSSPGRSGSRLTLVTAYSSTGETPVLDSNSFPPPIVHARGSHDSEPPLTPAKVSAMSPVFNDSSDLPGVRRRLSSSSRISSVCERRVHRAIPRWVRRPLSAWWGRVAMVLSPEWLTTTILVWGAWFAMSLGKSFIIRMCFCAPS